jgi:hypothetical protein
VAIDTSGIHHPFCAITDVLMRQRVSSSLAPLTQRGALAARVAHTHEVGRSIRPAATNRVSPSFLVSPNLRVSPSLVTERVCKTCAYVHAEFDSRDTHHAALVYWQGLGVPLR